jgi:predicted nucleic acid-binding protein
MKCLLDASSFLLLVKKADVRSTVECLRDSFILDLTFYEVGNAIWKEGTLMKFLTSEEAERLGTMAQTILAKVNRANSEAGDFQKILEIAQTEKLSYYDSSYVYLAKKAALPLVSEDKELRTKAQKYTDTHTVAELLSQ